jgi:hypothetical protein
MTHLIDGVVNFLGHDIDVLTQLEYDYQGNLEITCMRIFPFPDDKSHSYPASELFIDLFLQEKREWLYNVCMQSQLAF